LLGREAGIAGLGDGGPEDVEHADVGPLPGDAPEAFIEGFGVEARELVHAADAEPTEIAQQGGSHTNQVG